MISLFCKKCTHFKWDYNYMNRSGIYLTCGFCTKHQRYCKFVKNCQDKEEKK